MNMANASIEVSVKCSDTFHKMTNLIRSILDNPLTPMSIKLEIKETVDEISKDIE
jgi:hypothetical protein